MTGRKRKLKQLTESASTSTGRTMSGKNEKLKLQNWSELPTELLKVIASRLSLYDNIRASVVCKRWHSAAVSVRVVNQAPWLMFFPEYGDQFQFYDPSKRKIHKVGFPQLIGPRICYTKCSWLLLYKGRTLRPFFFNPFTQEVIKLPRFELDYQAVAFSDPPTSKSCSVCTIGYVSLTVVVISTCHPGALEWTTAEYQHHLPFVSKWNQLVFCNDLFYCRGCTGWVGVFNQQERTWSVLSVPPPKGHDNWRKGKFMTEKDGDILFVDTCSSETPIVFKLDQRNMVWEELKNLDGATIFASSLTTYVNINLFAIKGNNIYFPRIRRLCISYSLDDGRYHPRNKCHDWGDQDPLKTIWIEPPEGFAGFE